MNFKAFHFKYLLVVLLLVAVAIFVSVYSKKAPDASKIENGTYTDKTAGISVNYPNDIFSVSKTANGFALASQYYVRENYKGTPDGQFDHFFQIEFEKQSLGIMDAIEQYDAYGDAFMQSFENATISGFKPSESAKNYSAGGKNGFLFTMGLEGTNTDFIFLPVSDKETLVVKKSYFTDFLSANVKPSPFSEQQEASAFDEVMASLKFIE